MKIFAWLLFLGVNFISYGQKIEGYQFVGLRDYRFNHKNEEIEKRTFDANHHLESFVRYIYDMKGNKIETLKYSNDSTLLTRYVYFFNANNDKIRNIKIDYEKDIEIRKAYFYNEKGENIRTEYFDVSGLTNYSEVTYTDKSEYKSRKSFDNDGKLKYAYRYEYTYENGQIVEKRCFSIGNELISKNSYEYDENGLKLSYSSNYISSRRTCKKRLYKYNAAGQCIRSLVYEKSK